jgi:hypothetical protein
MEFETERGRSAATETTPNSSLHTHRYTDSPDSLQEMDEHILNAEDYLRFLAHHRSQVETLLRSLRLKRECLDGLYPPVEGVQSAQ